MIRHTRVEVGPGMCYGQTDVDVADSFEEEAQAYHQSLPLRFDAVFCSPLSRCRKLAERLDRGVPHFDDRIKELSFGAWENTPWNAIDPVVLEEWMKNFVHQPPPGGESFQEFFDRAASFYDDLTQKDYKKVLVVAHAGIFRCTWAYLLGIPLDHLFRLQIGFGETLVFQHDPDPSRRRITSKQ